MAAIQQASLGLVSNPCRSKNFQSLCPSSPVHYDTTMHVFISNPFPNASDPGPGPGLYLSPYNHLCPSDD